MKILQVMAGGKHGGAETAFVDISIALHEAGEHIEAVTRANDIRVSRLREAGIPVHVLPFGGRFDVYTHWRMRKIIKAFRPDIVQAWMSRAGRFVPKWSESLHVPRYVTVARLGGYYKLKYYKSIEYFVTVTPDIADYLVREGVDPARVRAIANFSEEEFPEAPLDRGAYGVPADAPLLLAMGRLHKVKGFDMLIRAVAQVPGAYLWIAGEGKGRGELEALIASLGVEDRVRLLGWRTDRAALFEAADICTFSSRFEPFGTVFVQAWARRTPLITTNSDGPRQYVRDGEDALVVPVDDEAAMAAAIRRVIEDPDLGKRLAAAGYARYEAEFTKARCVANYLDFYHSVKSK